MKRYGSTCLLDLPIKPICRDGFSDSIQEQFVSERKALSRPEEIRPFVRKWHSIWRLQVGPLAHPSHRVLRRAEVDDLLSLNFDAKKVFRILQDDTLFKLQDKSSYIMAHLAIPEPMLRAFELSQHYGVATNLGMVRLFLDTYPQHEMAWRF